MTCLNACWGQVIHRALAESADMLLVMMFLLALTLVVFSTAEYFCERGVWDAALRTYVRPGDVGDDGLPRESPFRCQVALLVGCRGQVVKP